MAQDADTTELRLSVAEAAQLLQVSERTVRRWVDDLRMPCRTENSVPTFDRSELIDWADAHSFRLAADVHGEPDAPLPALSDAICAGGIHYDVPGRTVDEALDRVAHRLDLPDLVDRSFFHQVLLAREDLGSTGIGDGVAVPHVRAPLVLHVEQPLVGLFFLEHPVDWGAIDGKPVETLFVVVSPAVRPHLHLLSRIAFSLRDPEFRMAIVERRATPAILALLRELEA